MSSYTSVLFGVSGYTAAVTAVCIKLTQTTEKIIALGIFRDQLLCLCKLIDCLLFTSTRNIFKNSFMCFVPSE